MATTITNTSVNSRLTIIFDANGDLDGNGPAKVDLASFKLPTMGAPGRLKLVLISIGKPVSF